ncbi:MAG: DUF480 domain-containing protein [Moritella sp.]|uniref:YceH family protein n=1 Tax=unclassified Moritella TaxID=2637987 RepID=UPI00015685A5|nr:MULTISPECIES: YceH family protein [unclassified Moritella]EDM68344.1 hypothetical protein PE36_16144 [Moritella sp. PE36]MBL1417238.1 YceH family protein [Moritella sp.]PHR87013.1 MAG: DUF480 domain-containing protein [Moritella sp.]
MDELSLHETRVLGALIEKEHTTPDNYPLSLNSLTSACNQKSSREPVLSLSQDDVQNIVDDLVKKRLVVNDEHGGKRGAKIRHRFGNTEFSKIRFNPQQLAIITLLFLRGPQTPGELRTRSARQCQFNDVQEVETALEQLINHELHPFVVKLDREPGQSACRYAHLFSGTAASTATATDSPVLTRNISADENDVLTTRVDELEQEVATLKAQLTELQETVDLLIK